MKNIFKNLKELLNNSYSPYSKYKVASIVETELGFFKGVNVECGAYPLSICAEKSAIVNAISNGSKKFKKIYLLTQSEDILGTPCGGCRQFISEQFDSKAELIVFNLKGESKIFKIEELLPFPWKSSTLLNNK